ncbi:MAG TPA: serine/threonine-protein phosphatase [Gemmatimonadaceae bacterium]|jgi:serine/threonine protein phosphatase PrpC|nr:serine/threonine-protein phosphatase [Gemmatimonadota bacterium]MBK9408053.1 serine/threonine-protein phosphatase [Gemmatimonadota bacterium]MBK9980036.1 serine/threonine-protein phosphatase [Gemmatimonadota bacterium]MBP9107280.1 serine/threonine-protein phosphatase [Gemmatimonadaceae bacterium]HPV74284.1 serine/threonine-protein phosphatase [Gemmatimonadaceae bacterium]
MTIPPLGDGTPGGAPHAHDARDRGTPRDAMLTDVYGLSHTGLVPTENQDHFVVARMRKIVEVTSTNLDTARLAERMHGGEAWLMAVADGVGGRAGGAEASSRAVETTLEYLGQATGCYHRFDVDEEAKFIEKMEAAVQAAHAALRGEHGDTQWSPATTLTMVMLVAPRAYIVHVGDTRAYYLRGERLLQLTRDQTFGQYLLDSGAMTDAQVADSPMGRTLASAVGSSEVHPAVGLIDLEAGDTLLLCSDGLTKHVANDQVQRLLREATGARAACEALVAAALAGGGSDNISVVVARFGAPADA